MAARARVDLPKHPAVPAGVHERVEQRRRHSPHAAKEALGRLIPKLHSAHLAGQERVSNQLGADEFQRLFAGRPTASRTARGSDNRAAASATAAGLERLRDIRVGESRAFLGQLGLRPDHVKGVLADANRDLIDVVAEVTFDRQPDLLDTVDIPEPLDIRRPPYPGFSTDEAAINNGGYFHIFRPWSWRNVGGHFEVETIMRIDPPSGSVESTINARDPRAADWDDLVALAQAFVGFWYQMPTAGRVEVIVEAVPDPGSYHSLSLTNELGWSTSSVTQQNGIALRCTGPDSEFFTATLLTEFVKDGETEGSWFVSPFGADDTRWLRMSSTTSFPAGSFVFIEVGNDTLQTAAANDVSVVSVSAFTWTFNSIRVSVRA